MSDQFDDLDPALVEALALVAKQLKGRKQSVEALKYMGHCLREGLEFSVRISKGPKDGDLAEVNLHTGPGSSGSTMTS